MKRFATTTTLAAAICLTTAGKSYAQYSPLTFGVRAGINMADMSDEFSSRFKYQFGVSADYEISDKFYILSGLDLTVKGGKRKLYDQEAIQAVPQNIEVVDGKRVNLYASPMYLQIPVHMACKVDLPDNMKLVFNTGPYLAMGIGGKSKLDYKSQGIKYTNEFDYFGKHKASRFDMGLGMGIGIEREGMVMNLGYDFGLLNKKQIAGAKAKNRNIALTVGYKFL